MAECVAAGRGFVRRSGSSASAADGLTGISVHPGPREDAGFAPRRCRRPWGLQQDAWDSRV